MKKTLLLSIFLLSFTIQAQNNYWEETSVSKEEVKENLLGLTLENVYHLNFKGIKAELLKAPIRNFENSNVEEGIKILFPNSNGEIESFRVVEASNFSEALSVKYPSIKSYRGKSVENPSKIISISISSTRLKAIYFSEDETSLLEPISDDTNTYIVYEKDSISIHENFKCLTESTENSPVEAKQTDDMTLRTFKLAVATDGEFGQYYGSTSAALAGINDLMTIINPIYERDLSIKLELVPNTDQLIYLNPTTDPFQYASQTNNNLNSATQSTISGTIGEANYDVGILFSSQADGGNAGCISCVCVDNSKGSAYAGGSGFPEGYYFAMIIAHEMGHQFGANHTFSRSEGTNANTEPGSGTTIMSYAGVTFLFDVQPQPDNYFSHFSINQISSNIQNTNCATEVIISNSNPVVDAGNNYTIPSGTAFKLTAAGSDSDVNDQLTYSWEQADPNNVVFNNYLYPSPSSTQSPNFRIYNPTTSPVQYFPPFEEVLFGSLYSTWNMTSTVSRNFNFIVQVRDNSLLGGQTASDNMQVQVQGNAGPFKITSIDDYDGFAQSTQHNLTWDVSGTNGGIINTANVKISISIDGGNSFSTLIASTANDGQENITFPAQDVEEAFIMIEAIGNIYYAVSPSFAIGNDSVVNCDEFIEQGPISVPANGSTAQVDINVPNSGIIEDVNITMDISGGPVGNLLVFLFGPNDTDPTILYSASCGGNSLDVTFDQEGESIVLNCGNSNGQAVEPIGGDLSKYYGTDRQGDWSIIVLNLGGATGTVINSAGIEFCSREVVNLSTESFSNKSLVKLYPNPTNGELNMHYKSTSGQEMQINVFDLTGKQVFEKTNNFTVANSTSLDLSTLVSGVYLVKVNDGSQQFVKKLIIK